jgi:flagellar biosynthetic protein FliP
VRRLLAALAIVLFGVLAPVQAASADPVIPTPTVPEPPTATTRTTVPAPSTPGANAGEGAGADAGVSINVAAPDLEGKGAGNVVVLLLAIGVLSIVPSLLILLTSFPRIVIVLSMARNAVGLPTVPPNQVITGLALFLTLFVMGPTLSQINDAALKPLLDDKITITQAIDAAEDPLREFMLDNTRDAELKLMMDAADVARPVEREKVPLNALIPAFLLSEIRSAFIIGFAIFLPFLVIDLIVASVLQSLGLMMLPPTFVSLPFKVMLFVLAGGWTLVVESLLGSFR